MRLFAPFGFWSQGDDDLDLPLDPECVALRMSFNWNVRDTNGRAAASPQALVKVGACERRRAAHDLGAPSVSFCYNGPDQLNAPYHQDASRTDLGLPAKWLDRPIGRRRRGRPAAKTRQLRGQVLQP